MSLLSLELRVGVRVIPRVSKLRSRSIREEDGDFALPWSARDDQRAQGGAHGETSEQHRAHGRSMWVVSVWCIREMSTEGTQRHGLGFATRGSGLGLGLLR